VASPPLCPADAPPIPGAIAGPVVWQGTPGVLVLVPDAAAPTQALILGVDCATVLERAELG
jgi:hypothetical protein